VYYFKQILITENTEMSKRVSLVSIITILLVCFFTTITLAADHINIPHGKDVNVIIEPASSAELQILYILDEADNELYNFHLAGDAANFTIDKKYLLPGKQYSLYLIAFSASNIPSDISNTVPFIIDVVEIPEERYPPEKVLQEGSKILEVN
jgi:hypothetical protein